jgi:hypothetical protein
MIAQSPSLILLFYLVAATSACPLTPLIERMMFLGRQEVSAVRLTPTVRKHVVTIVAVRRHLGARWWTTMPWLAICALIAVPSRPTNRLGGIATQDKVNASQEE